MKGTAMRLPRRLALLVVCLTLLPAVPTLAQETVPADRTNQWAAAVNDPIVIAESETLAVVTGIHNEVIVDGTVEHLLFVIDGHAIVNGRLPGAVVVISGTLTLNAGAEVNEITLVRSELIQHPDATVTGFIESRSNVFFLEWWSSPLFALVVWLVTTLFLLAGGLVFALASGQQFFVFARSATSHVLANIATAAIVWIGLPLLAFLVMLTIIGIPLGFVILGLVIPGIWWLGYTVIGARLGTLLFAIFNPSETTGHAVLATLIGMLALQLTILIPYIGGTIIFISGLYGSGALIYHLIRGRHERPIDPELVSFGPELARTAPGAAPR